LKLEGDAGYFTPLLSENSSTTFFSEAFFRHNGKAFAEPDSVSGACGIIFI